MRNLDKTVEKIVREVEVKHDYEVKLNESEIGCAEETDCGDEKANVRIDGICKVSLNI